MYYLDHVSQYTCNITVFPFDLPCKVIDICLSYRKTFCNSVSLHRQYAIKIDDKIFMGSHSSHSSHLLNATVCIIKNLA